MKNNIQSTLVRLRSEALHLLFNAALEAELTRPFGRAAYAHNRRLNASTIGIGGLLGNGFDKAEAVAFMRRIQLKTAIRWERHLRNGGHPKSLTRKGVTK
jgi:hypothetical protein